mmetsp:Transcript_110235/g.307172  ORF Transcript_110235/g.307172 Transcript_110235/m.307172 type:complete len:225 (+) Transcript_110235:440-1114(+)
MLRPSGSVVSLVGRTARPGGARTHFGATSRELPSASMSARRGAAGITALRCSSPSSPLGRGDTLRSLLRTGKPTLHAPIHRLFRRKRDPLHCSERREGLLPYNGWRPDPLSRSGKCALTHRRHRQRRSHRNPSTGRKSAGTSTLAARSPPTGTAANAIARVWARTAWHVRRNSQTLGASVCFMRTRRRTSMLTPRLVLYAPIITRSGRVKMGRSSVSLQGSAQP